MESTSQDPGRAGFVAIVGPPNVGKSTLLNGVLGQKISIVSRRPQTTRNRILGVLTRGADQIVFVDTPGIHRSRADLNRFMVEEALDSAGGVDCILLVTEIDKRRAGRLAGGEAPPLTERDTYVLDQVRRGAAATPLVVAINKVDLLDDKSPLLPLMAAWSARGHDAIVPISALTGDGVEQLLGELLSRLPEGTPLYPEDMITDRAERFLAAELVREQVFQRCRQEVPYSTAVSIEAFEERARRGDVRIAAVIHVERASQQGIVIGKGGAMVKSIGETARRELSRLLGCPVHLNLTVHVEAEWSRSPAGRRRLGYE